MTGDSITIYRPVALYHAPSRQAPLVALLDAESTLTLGGEHEGWYAVSLGDAQGYVSAEDIEAASDTSRGDLDEEPTRGGLDDVSAPLEPLPALQFPTQGQLSNEQKVVAGTWNRFGGMVAAVADSLGIDVALATAILAIEARGRAFGDDGRMIIRFENHIFYDLWGKQNANLFRQHFRFDAAQRWKGHQWRASSAQPWQDFHGIQANEWQVFTFARTLRDRAAKQSISMGLAQIMGFNHTDIGYPTVDEMFDALSADARAQIRGLFAFLGGTTAESKRVKALQKQDLKGFARLYNGENNVGPYSAKLGEHVNAFRQLWPDPRERTVSASGLNLRRDPEVGAPNVIRVLPQGTRVTLTPTAPTQKGGITWVRVLATDDVGWVSGAFLDPKIAL